MRSQTHEIAVGLTSVWRGCSRKRSSIIGENIQRGGLGSCWTNTGILKTSAKHDKEVGRSTGEGIGADTTCVDMAAGFAFSMETQRMRQFSKKHICLHENPEWMKSSLLLRDSVMQIYR